MSHASASSPGLDLLASAALPLGFQWVLLPNGKKRVCSETSYPHVYVYKKKKTEEKCFVAQIPFQGSFLTVGPYREIEKALYLAVLADKFSEHRTYPDLTHSSMWTLVKDTTPLGDLARRALQDLTNSLARKILA